MKKTCCCTGHRPGGFPFYYISEEKSYIIYLQTLEEKIKLAITDFEIRHFISGMAIGVDLDFAEFVLKFKKKYRITLECAIPCANQSERWFNCDKKRYKRVLAKADKITLISEDFTPTCMLERNRYMVNKSDLVIAVFNGIKKGGTWYTINYAKKTNKTIDLLDLCKL